MTELTVIVPTFNEKDNIPILVDLIAKNLSEIDHSILIVDDNSKDFTWKVAQDLEVNFSQLSSIRRVGRKGLSSAVIEGILACSSEYIAVIDADLQHDETILCKMLEAAKSGADVVVGSRYVPGGGTGDWNKNRLKVSQGATALVSYLFKHKISDPMSGFFLMKRDKAILHVEKLDGKGFKILLDLLSNFSPEEIEIQEVAYEFKSRIHGESKLSPLVAVQFFEFLYSKKVGHLVPLRFTKFIIVGFLGSFVHFFLLALCFKSLNFSYQYSLIIAIEMAIIFNFFVNNIWTFGDFKLKKSKIITGLLKFNLASVFGGFISFIVSVYFLESMKIHWALSSLIGAMAGALWNYNLSKILTWKTK